MKGRLSKFLDDGKHKVEVPQHPSAGMKLAECLTKDGWFMGLHDGATLFVNHKRGLIRWFNEEFLVEMLKVRS